MKYNTYIVIKDKKDGKTYSKFLVCHSWNEASREANLFRGECMKNYNRKSNHLVLMVYYAK